MSVKTLIAAPEQSLQSAPQSRFWEKSAAIASARQHQPDGQNPIVTSASLTNTAQAWLHCAFTPTPKRGMIGKRSHAHEQNSS
jgi:hypothetical protein